MKILKTSWFIIISLSIISCSILNSKQEQDIVELQKDVYRTLNKVHTKIASNPETALKNSVSALDTILEYTETVKSDPSKFSKDKIQDYILKIKIINENMERFSDLTLQTDVSFPLGTYKLKYLSKKGKRKIDELADKIIVSTKRIATKYPTKPIKVMIKTIGYTDETDIVAGSKLEKAIVKKLAEPVAIKHNQRRKQYNQVLSKFRSSTLSQYIVQYLQQKLSTINTVTIMTDIHGLGEKFPSSTESNYNSKDPRRRICIISPFIEIIP